jgi:hypothetical protein
MIVSLFVSILHFASAALHAIAQTVPPIAG